MPLFPGLSFRIAGIWLLKRPIHAIGAPRSVNHCDACHPYDGRAEWPLLSSCLLSLAPCQMPHSTTTGFGPWRTEELWGKERFYLFDLALDLLRRVEDHSRGLYLMGSLQIRSLGKSNGLSLSNWTFRCLLLCGISGSVGLLGWASPPTLSVWFRKVY